MKKFTWQCNDHDYCYVQTPNEHNKILKYSQGEKSVKAPFIIYSDLQCWFEKMFSCRNNPEKSYTEKKLSIRLLVTHCLQIVHLIRQKTNLIVAKVKTVWKGFVKT